MKMGRRSACCDKVGLRKGTWTPEEDQKLLSFIEQHGHGSWRALPAKAGLERCGKSCRLRWTNYLRPDIKRGKFTLQEEQTIIQLHALLGNRWSAIATHLPKRTDNEIKNYWNTHLKKRLTKMGIDPSTHKPKINPLGSSAQKDTANLSHMAQWESARLEAESRLVRESKLLNKKVSVSVPVSVPMTILPCLDVLKAWQFCNNNNNGFFNSPAGTLQSPTSTLHFSDNVFGSGAATSNLLPFLAVPKAAAPALAEDDEDHHVDVLGDFPIDHAAAYLNYDDESLRQPPPSFMEGFGPFHGDLDGTGDLEDNRKYWNSILNEENPTVD